MTADIYPFPGSPATTEHRLLTQLIVAFDALPDAMRVALVNVLADRIPVAYGRALAAMLAQRYPSLPIPKTSTDEPDGA
jgi:hypothetical protein